MKTRELYESIENPMDQEHFLDDIVSAYVGDESFYGALVKTHFRSDKDQKVTSCFFNDYRNQYYLYIYREWKSSLEYIASHSNFSKVRRDYATLLLKYLKDKDPHNYEDVLSILNRKGGGEDSIHKALDYYRWDKLSSLSAWEYADSHDIYSKTHKREIIEHRLYLNCDSYLVHVIALEFMKKCKERKLKFSFKFDENGARDDVMVFYSSTKNLVQYVEILEEIKEEYGLDNHIYEPPVLTGKIHGWLGYGTEPNILGNQYSFNGFREMHLSNCIKKEVGSWIRHNPNMPIVRGNKEIPYSNYLMNQIVEYVRKKCMQKREYSDSYNYCDKAIKSISFYRAILQEVKSNIHEILDFFEGKEISLTIEIPYMGHTIIIDQFDLERILQSQVKMLYQYYAPFHSNLLKRIQSTCDGYGISENYAIDLHAKKLFEEVIEKEEQEDKKWLPMTEEEVLEARRQLKLV